VRRHGCHAVEPLAAARALHLDEAGVLGREQVAAETRASRERLAMGVVSVSNFCVTAGRLSMILTGSGRADTYTC
jgi:hypothetical protein